MSKLWMALAWVFIALAVLFFISAVRAAGQPCNWNSDCGYNEICVPVKRGWGTPRMCVEKPDGRETPDQTY